MPGVIRGNMPGQSSSSRSILTLTTRDSGTEWKAHFGRRDRTARSLASGIILRRSACHIDRAPRTRSNESQTHDGTVARTEKLVPVWPTAERLFQLLLTRRLRRRVVFLSTISADLLLSWSAVHRHRYRQSRAPSACRTGQFLK